MRHYFKVKISKIIIFLFVMFISFLQKHKNTKYIYKYNITQYFQDPQYIQNENLPNISPRPEAIK